jgi:hypothetical protein
MDAHSPINLRLALWDTPSPAIQSRWRQAMFPKFHRPA